MNTVFKILLAGQLVGIANLATAKPASGEHLLVAEHVQKAPLKQKQPAPAPAAAASVASAESPTAAAGAKSSYNYEVCNCLGGSGFTQTNWAPEAACQALKASNPNVVLSTVAIDGDSLHWGYYSSPPYNACVQRFTGNAGSTLQSQLDSAFACATYRDSNWIESSNRTNCMTVSSADGWGPWGYQAPLTTYTEEELQATYEQYTSTAAKSYGGGSVAASSVVDKSTIPQPAAAAAPAGSSNSSAAAASPAAASPAVAQDTTSTSGGTYSYELCSCNSAPFGQPSDNTCGKLAGGAAAGSYGTKYDASNILLTGVNFNGQSGTPDFTLVWTQGNNMLTYWPWTVCARRFNDPSQPSLEQLWTALPSNCSPKCDTYTKTAGPDPWSCPRNAQGEYVSPSLTGCTQYTKV